MQPSARAAQLGASLVEAAVVLGIATSTVGLTASSIGQLRDRAHLRGASAQLETDLQLARSSAVALNRVVRLSFDDVAAGSCYVVHTGPAGACRCGDNGKAMCEPKAETLRTVLVPADSGVRISSNSASIGFEPIQGMVTPTATMKLSNRSDEAIHLVINIMGRVRSCTPTAKLQGETLC